MFWFWLPLATPTLSMQSPPSRHNSNNLISDCSFVAGMVSLYYGYLYKYFEESTTKDISPWLIGVLVLTTIFSLIGAMRSLYTQTRTSWRSCCPTDESPMDMENVGESKGSEQVAKAWTLHLGQCDIRSSSMSKWIVKLYSINFQSHFICSLYS